jgi:hypothetical protein
MTLLKKNILTLIQMIQRQKKVKKELKKSLPPKQKRVTENILQKMVLVK